MNFSRFYALPAALFVIFGISAEAKPIHLLTSATGDVKANVNADFNVTEEQMLSVPIWHPESEPAPLQFVQALKIAQDWLKSRGETRIRLNRYSVCSYGARWYYEFNFVAEAQAPPLHISSAIVLMNGVIVEPAVSTVVHSQPTPAVAGAAR